MKSIDLNSRAVCAILSVSGYDGRKLDKAQSRDVESRAGAKSGTARVTKSLIPKTEFAEITAARGALRQYHYDNTLPFVTGMQLRPLAGFLDYETEMRKLIATYDTACDRFAERYRQMHAIWLADLGTLGKASEYPDPDQVRDRFHAALSVRPVGDLSTWLTDVSDAERERLVAQARAAEREMVDRAVSHCFDRLSTAVRHISERMKEYRAKGHKGKLFESMIGNVRDLIECLPDLNVTDDPALTAAIDLCRDKLAPIQVEALRISETECARAESTADEILAAMSAYTGRPS